MNRRSIARTALPLAALAVAGALTVPSADAADNGHGRATTYLINGDEGGSKFEGIGVNQRSGAFYVSEVTGGEIHRGIVGTAQTQQWLDGDGTDGRYTARGITTDDAGNVYIAGGPNGIGTGRPDLWVYSPEGKLLAAIRVPGTPDAFLNDVAIGRDGAAYFTNSNDAQIFRVAKEHGKWQATKWADATDKIQRVEGFNLGGIVLSADKSALVVAQGNTGDLWRFDMRTAAVSKIDIGDADLFNADGLVLQGDKLTIVRNFSKVLVTMRLDAHGTRARLISAEATDPDRVLTTAKILRGQTLFVDSKFDETVASGPYEIITNPVVQ